MNKLTIIGRLTRDPEMRSTQTGKDVCNFTVAVNRRQKKADGTTDADFFRVAAWNKLAESCQQYLGKGKLVCVTGVVSVSTYQTQDGQTRAQMEVMAEDVEFLTPKGESGAAPQEQPVAQSPMAAAVPVVSDDLPF